MGNGEKKAGPRIHTENKPRLFHWARRFFLNLIPKKRGDERIFERVPAKLTIRYRNLQSKEWGLLQTRDISAKGIGLVSKDRIPHNTPLELWLPVPGRGESVYSQGKIVWSKTIWFSEYHAGIKLNRPDLVGLLPILRQRLLYSS
ncbi:MAG: PilZ domain-containing protein [Candidatus Omnitrophota bacterium]|jgi:hypothetical protein